MCSEQQPASTQSQTANSRNTIIRRAHQQLLRLPLCRCVSSAVHDLSLHMSAQTRRSFAAAYLSHLEGESVDAVQTELLAFDMLIAGIVHFGVLRPTLFWDGTGWNKAKAITLQRALTLLAQLRQIVQAVSEDLSERMVQGCLEGSLCSMLVDRVDSISLFWYEDQFMPSVLT